MKVSMDKIHQGITRFIDNDILPLSASMNNVEQFIFGMAVALIKQKASTIIQNFAGGGLAKLSGIINEEGAVDIDTLYLAAKDTMKRVQVLKIADIKLREPDLDKLYSYIIS